MGKIISTTLTILGAGLFCIPVCASEPILENIFHADMTHTDIADVVVAFQDICMPFVLHETELPQAENWHHQAVIMKQKNYTRHARVTKSRQLEYEPSREEWKPQSRAINPPRHFTVFNGASTEIVTAVKPLVMQTGEIDMRAYIPPRLITTTVPSDSYTHNTKPNITAVLDWNYASQKDPGKSCTIALTNTTLKYPKFVQDFIAKDSAWKKPHLREEAPAQWTQCVKDSDNEFEFTAQHQDGEIKLSMKRSDFYERKLCKS